MTESFDVIVIGAGPAGSAAAFTAADYGLSVLLLEEHEKIGQPVVCAEGLSRSTIKDYLDIQSEWISEDLKGAIVRGPDDREFSVEYPTCGWVLDRLVFDSALARRAQAKGAIVKTMTKAIGITENIVYVQEKVRKKQYRYKIIIGADGIISRVGAWLGVDTRLGLNEIEVCAEYLVENINIKPGYAHLVFGETIAPGGYAWIFPKSSSSANIGLGISPLKTKTKAKHLLDRWLIREFPNAKIVRHVYGGTPAQILDKISGKNYFLVGDAARFTDPLSGAGIANGIKSGIIAGHNAWRRLKGHRITYIQEITSALGKEIRFHARVRKAFLKCTDQEYKIIFDIGKKIFHGKHTKDINIRHIVRAVLLHSPRILGRAYNLLV